MAQLLPIWHELLPLCHAVPWVRDSLAEHCAKVSRLRPKTVPAK